MVRYLAAKIGPKMGYNKRISMPSQLLCQVRNVLLKEGILQLNIFESSVAVGIIDQS